VLGRQFALTSSRTLTDRNFHHKTKMFLPMQTYTYQAILHRSMWIGIPDAGCVLEKPERIVPVLYHLIIFTQRPTRIQRTMTFLIFISLVHNHIFVGTNKRISICCKVFCCPTKTSYPIAGNKCCCEFIRFSNTCSVTESACAVHLCVISY
jgi:hypothetical protein